MPYDALGLAVGLRARPPERPEAGARARPEDGRELRLALACGRPHRYEGWSDDELETPVRALAAAGVSRLVLTNSCGALRPEAVVGRAVVCSAVVDLQRPPPATCRSAWRCAAEAEAARVAEALGEGAAPRRRHLRLGLRPAVRDAGGGRLAGPLRRRGGHVGGAGGSRRRRDAA